MDPDNEPLRRIAEDLAKHFLALLCAAAWSPAGPMISESSDASLTVMCAHDSLKDASAQTDLAPHLIVDCTDLCMRVTDATMRNRLGDSEQTSYAAEAAASQKAVKNADKLLKKVTAKAQKAKKKADAAAAKVAKLGDKAGKKLKSVAEKTLGQLGQAEEAVRQAKRKAAEAEKTAKKAVANAEAAAKIQASIVKCWCSVVNTLTTSNSHFTDARAGLTYVESCKAYVAPCLKCKHSTCQCK